MYPSAVILQNAKKKSGHTHTMYMDNEVKENLLVGNHFSGRWDGKGEIKNLIVTKDLILGSIDDSFQVKDEHFRLDNVPIFIF